MDDGEKLIRMLITGIVVGSAVYLVAYLALGLSNGQSAFCTLIAVLLWIGFVSWYYERFY